MYIGNIMSPCHLSYRFLLGRFLNLLLLVLTKRQEATLSVALCIRIAIANTDGLHYTKKLLHINKIAVLFSFDFNTLVKILTGIHTASKCSRMANIKLRNLNAYNRHNYNVQVATAIGRRRT